jgi:hypothetical protein
VLLINTFDRARKEMPTFAALGLARHWRSRRLTIAGVKVS